MILALKAQLDQLHNKYCLTDTEVPTRETDTEEKINCEWNELEATKDYLVQIDKIIQDSLFKAKDEESRKTAMLGFVEMRILFDARITQLFKDRAQLQQCNNELMQIKISYM